MTESILTAALAESVLEFWFGTFDEDGQSPADRRARWWKKDPDFDAEIRERFLPAYRALMDSGLGGWSESPRTAMAVIIVLDQFSRNMFRDTAEMYAADPLALECLMELVEEGADVDLLPMERAFVYMPFMHAESLELQDRCIELFGLLKEDVPEALKGTIDGHLKAAYQHRKIVARFGRFPHRNEILGRDSTAEETSFLAEPGSSF